MVNKSLVNTFYNGERTPTLVNALIKGGVRSMALKLQTCPTDVTQNL